MSETANPTNEEFYASLQLVDGRASAAQAEIVRRLEANMPGKIAYLNGILYPGKRGIPVPAGYHVAPAVLTEDYLNTILVSVVVSTLDQGAGSFRNESTVYVYSVDERIETPQQVQDTFDRCGVVRGILYHFLTGCIDAAGRSLWRQLKPTGHALALPPQWGQAGYVGTMSQFLMVQSPDNNNWV